MPQSPDRSTSLPKLLVDLAKNSDIDGIRALLLDHHQSGINLRHNDRGTCNTNTHADNGANHKTDENGHGVGAGAPYHSSITGHGTSIRHSSHRAGFVNTGHGTNGRNDPHSGISSYRRGFSSTLDINSTDPTDGQQRTALYWASARGSTEICRLLLDHGANPHRRLATTDATPLHAAADNGSADITKMLLDR